MANIKYIVELRAVDNKRWSFVEECSTIAIARVVAKAVAELNKCQSQVVVVYGDGKEVITHSFDCL